MTTTVLRLNGPEEQCGTRGEPPGLGQIPATGRGSRRLPRLGEATGAITDTAEEAPADHDPGFRNIGCQIVCSPRVADEIAQRLREAVGEILDDYTDGDVFDYGVD